MAAKRLGILELGNEMGWGVQMCGTHVKFILSEKFIEEEVDKVGDTECLRSMRTGRLSFHC